MFQSQLRLLLVKEEFGFAVEFKCTLLLKEGRAENMANGDTTTTIAIAKIV